MSQERHETGVMQFEDDWPGVFIRGDNAAHYALMIAALLSMVPDTPQSRFIRNNCRELERLLESCKVKPAPKCPCGKDSCYCDDGDPRGEGFVSEGGRK